jgi:Lar family restriction alleviation protein
MKKHQKLKSCPFCGNTPQTTANAFQFVDSMKWGAVKCGCGACGPDVRTNYKNGEWEDWYDDAIEAWNRRSER